jgi:hypothetical protein
MPFIIGKRESVPYEVRSKIYEQFRFISVIKVFIKLFFGDRTMFSLPLKKNVFQAFHNKRW